MINTKIEKEELETVEPEEKHCPECGTEIPDGYVFCPECGTKLTEQVVTPKAQKSDEE